MPVASWADPVPLASHPLFTSADYRALVVDVIRDLADQGECLIVGHAAHIVLRDRPDTLKVLVTGSVKARVTRVMVGMAVDEKAALKTLERVDGERSDYFRRFFDTEWLTPASYDLCVSTDHLSVANAAELIATAATLR